MERWLVSGRAISIQSCFPYTSDSQIFLASGSILLLKCIGCLKKLLFKCMSIFTVLEIKAEFQKHLSIHLKITMNPLHVNISKIFL